MREELQAVREALFHFDLERVVFAACIVTQVVALVSRAALQDARDKPWGRTGSRQICLYVRRIRVTSVSEVVVVGPTVQLRRLSAALWVSAISNHGRIVNVVGWPVASKDMRTLVANVSHLDRGRAVKLTLRRSIPGVESWQALGGWANMRLHAELRVLSRRVENWILIAVWSGYREQSIRWNCREIKDWRSLRQGKRRHFLTCALS